MTTMMMTMMTIMMMTMMTIIDDDDDDDHDDDHDDHDDHHDHDDHGPPCYCKAIEQGWDINCADAASIVTTAVNFLTDTANGCNFDDAGEDAACLEAFHVFQAHHDYCPHHALDDVDDAE